MNKLWTPREVAKLFRITKTKTSILRDEANSVIPKAERLVRGKSLVRAWKRSDLPALGKAYGFLNLPKKTEVLSIYTAKGGVLKTTFSYNLARMLALNGIKTLVIGLDVQCSITDLLANLPEVNSIEEITSLPGLFEISTFPGNKAISIFDSIQKSDLPTLDFIPESINLNLLEQKIRDEKKREHYLLRLIQPLKEVYQVIIFDNAPSWNFLIQNSLVAANVVISPIGCDIGTYRSVSQNIGIISDYKKEMELYWSRFIIVPTLLEKTKLSTQIEAQYKTMYPELITNTSIRRAIKGQESILKNASVIELESSSPLANDYYETITEVWEKILGSSH